jgi:hypothetical protein
MSWTRATHLNQWADTELASRHLPLLVRKLVRRTVPDLTKLNIPVNEQTVRPGFDGIVECSVGNQYVPSGKSAWEMGTDLDPKTKASGDIAKRTKELSDAQRGETTFVFVTPRPWQKKDKWAEEMARHGGWKGVVVHDSNDLEHWLDFARDIDAWISHETRQIPASVQSLEHHWKSLCKIGEHELRPKVFTASRETEIQSVEQLLNRDPNSLFIRTPGLSDGIDFLAGLAAQQSEGFRKGDPAVEPQYLSLLQNAVIVFDQDDWRQFAQSDGPLLLIASPTLQVSSTDVATAVQAGHYVIVSGPRGIVPADRGIVLRGVQQYDLEEALQASGYSDSQAGSLAKACVGNTTILKRRIATHPDTVLPGWAKPEVGPDLAFFALLGGWAHIDPKPPTQKDVPEVLRYIPPIDLTVLELVGYKLSDLDRLIAQWQEWPEPFFLRFGDTILVTSREDAWYLLGDYVTNEQLKQFGDLAVLVLEEDNPALELEPEQRWMADVYGKRHSMSGELRKSLVETLAIMATCPTVKHASPGNRFTAIIDRVVDSVLPPKCDWKRWASLRSHFGVLAEAAPEFFLGRIEEDLKSPAPAVPQLFQEQTGSLTGGWMHCELLWALESLAWSPEHLSRVSVILAKLVSLIPAPGNHGNRPENSLHEIFLLWLPHTNATISERIAALNQVLQTEPAVGWSLLLNLLPAGHTTFSTPTSMPRWRSWADGWSRESVNRQLYDYAMAVADLTFTHIGDEHEKWSKALGGMLRFNAEVSDRTIRCLKGIADKFKKNPNGAFQLWDALRSTIQIYQDYSDPDRAIAEATLDELIKVRDQLTPTDLVLLNRWLFDAHVHLPGYRSREFAEHEAALEEARTRAIRDICDVGRFDEVRRLLALGADGRKVGYICGKHALLIEHVAQLPQSLTDADRSVAAFAASYVIASYYHRGEWSWVNSLNPSKWSSSERTELAVCLPFEPKLWDWLENQGQEVQTKYWSRAGVWMREWDEPTIRRAVAGLLAARRPFSAIDLVNFHGEPNKPSDLIAEVLEAGLFQEAGEEMGNISYDIQELIGCLQADTSFDRQRLARLEWGYLPFLERSHSKTGADTLVAAAIESPSFFVDLIRYAYRGKDDPPRSSEGSENDRLQARRAGEFLDHLDRLPGMDESGTINSPALDAWVKSALGVSEASGHSEITAHKIGQFMGRAVYPHLDKTEVLSQLAPVVESHSNDDLTSGLVNGILNSRGVTSRGPFDGGKLEHELAAQFSERAKAVRSLSPKLAKCFSTIQSHYEDYARREDEIAERRRSGR